MDKRFQAMIGCFSIIGVIFTIVGVIVAILALVSPQRIIVVLQHVLPEATPVVVTVVSTPAPTQGAKLGPTLTVLRPTDTPPPMAVPSHTPTDTPVPTNTPVPSPTHTPLVNTPPGSVLALGETWYQDGISLRLDGWDPEGTALHFTIRSHLDHKVFLEVNGNNFAVHDPDNKLWVTDMSVFLEDYIDPGESKEFHTQSGRLFRPGEWSYFFVRVKELSRVREARWKVDIPH